MSLTLLGTRSVEPLRPSSDFLLGTFFDTFFAVSFALSATFFAVDLLFDVAFFATDADFLAVDFATALVLDAAVFVDFLTADDAFSAALAAELSFLADDSLKPADWSFLVPAFATFETVSIFAEINFLAVAAPTPGSAVSLSILEFASAAMCSLY